MKHLCISLLAVALLAPTAIAQQNAIAFADASLDAMPPPMNAYADLESATLERVDDATLRATIVIAALPEVQPGLGYGLMFTANGTEWYVALVNAEALVYYYGEWVDGYPATSFDTSGSYTTGLHATIAVDFPLAAIPNATEVTAPRAMVADFKALLVSDDAPIIIHDEATGEGALVVREPAPAPGPEAGAGEVEAASAPEDEATAPTTLSPQPARADTPLPLGIALVAVALALVRKR